MEKSSDYEDGDLSPFFIYLQKIYFEHDTDG